MEEIKVNIEKVDGAKDVVIRTGAIEEVEKPLPVVFVGVLSAPGDFLANRKELLNKDVCRLEVAFKEAHLKFFSDEKSKYRDTVEGKLTKSWLIDYFGINVETKKYTDKALAKFLRKASYYFPDQGDLSNLINALMKFEARVTQVFENNKDLKGNAKVMYEKTVEHAIPPQISVTLPIFEGYPEETFRLDIGAEATSSGVDFFFESAELFSLEETRKREILNAEIKKFQDFGCAILNK
jgi:hypothetical protein